MRVLVTGGRDFDDFMRVATVLTNLHVKRGPIKVVIHGGASGADALADMWAKGEVHKERSRTFQRASPPIIETMVFEAEWARLGKKAGPARNKLMIVRGKPDLVVAFPGGKGTADMVKRAHEYWIEVIEG